MLLIRKYKDTYPKLLPSSIRGDINYANSAERDINTGAISSIIFVKIKKYICIHVIDLETVELCSPIDVFTSTTGYLIIEIAAL